MRLLRTLNLPDATRGMLQDDEGTFLCWTLEEPWRDANRDGIGDRSVSRIPAGTFPVARRWSASRRCDVFEVREVPGRSAILIHSGNTVEDTEGCILLGQQEGFLGRLPAVLGSRKAVAAFMAMLRDVQGFTLEVLDCPESVP